MNRPSVGAHIDEVTAWASNAGLEELIDYYNDMIKEVNNIPVSSKEFSPTYLLKSQLETQLRNDNYKND